MTFGFNYTIGGYCEGNKSVPTAQYTVSDPGCLADWYSRVFTSKVIPVEQVTSKVLR